MRHMPPPILIAGYALSAAAAARRIPLDVRFTGQSVMTEAVVLSFLPLATTAIWLVLQGLVQRAPRSLGAHDATRTMILHVVRFLTAIHVLLVAALCGVPWMQFIAGRAVVVCVGLVLVAIGNEFPRTRPNLVFGIRTGRALRDRDLWMRLHRTLGHALVGIGTLTIYAGLILHPTQMAAVPVLATGIAALWISAVYWVLSRPETPAATA